MKSLSEIETISKRASRAVGFSWGVAEEIGKNIKQLELFGLPGIKHINQYFKIFNNENFENCQSFNKSNRPQNFYCPIKLGLSFFDQSISIQELNDIEIEKISKKKKKTKKLKSDVNELLKNVSIPKGLELELSLIHI